MAEYGLARINDLGLGICVNGEHEGHVYTGGFIMTGSGNVFCNGLPVASEGDIVLSFCGHIGIILYGNETVKVNNRNIATFGSLFFGDFMGNISEGSTNCHA